MSDQVPWPLILEPEPGVSPEEAYPLIQGFSWEPKPDDDPLCMQSQILLPPLPMEDRLQKGLLITSAADWLFHHRRHWFDAFHVLASSMSLSISRSKHADAVSCLYRNPERNRRYREQHGHRRILLPLQEADFTDETLFRPMPDQAKQYDFLCVARFSLFKNFKFLAKVMRAYKTRYGAFTLALPNGYRDRNPEHYEGDAADAYREFLAHVGDAEDCLRILPFRPKDEMPRLYNQAHAFIFTSLYEGKARALVEAGYCDLPTAALDAFNRFGRGPEPVFPEGAGLTLPADPDQFAQAMYHLRMGEVRCRPRDAYLRSGGRASACLQVAKAFDHPFAGPDADAFATRFQAWWHRSPEEWIYRSFWGVYDRAQHDQIWLEQFEKICRPLL